MNDIHPTAIISKEVKLGKNNRILPYTVLEGPLEIGDDNIIGPHVVIGSPGADTKNRYYDCSKSPIRIGNRNIIREFSAVQKARYGEMTLIEDDTFIMQGSNLSHDVLIESEVVITANSALAGSAKILHGANLGMGATISQYCVVGQYSIVATGAPATRNVRPFSRYIPNRPTSVNIYAIKKFGFEEFADEIGAYVIRNIRPKSAKILAVIDHYERLHLESKLGQYT
jgi:UDP-N-acetylglucosamine acyltransferase